ncbi:large ribosomal subunit protein mL48 isoform X1 [Pituophis catenifer annectens]|uniref:large ribosomal subunit protein mL48 isoform X1 n=1 Tax=Pituophis catenifer annectens TaxID=94852 RepID=UPI0039925CC4
MSSPKSIHGLWTRPLPTLRTLRLWYVPFLGFSAQHNGEGALVLPDTLLLGVPHPGGHLAQSPGVVKSDRKTSSSRSLTPSSKLGTQTREACLRKIDRLRLKSRKAELTPFLGFSLSTTCQVPQKRKNHVEMKEIDPGTEHQYGTLNVVMTGYDVSLVEHYAQYVHRLCNKLSVKVVESYAMPTKTVELVLAGDHGTKVRVDGHLTSHQRVVQIKQLTATLTPIFLEIIQNNLPEGVHLLVKEHTEEDFRIRLKVRPELDELRAKLQ